MRTLFKNLRKYVFNKDWRYSKTSYPRLGLFFGAVIGLIATPGEVALSAAPQVALGTLIGAFVGWVIGKLIERTDYKAIDEAKKKGK